MPRRAYIIVPAGLLLCLALMALTASGRDIVGDWVIDIPTAVSDETINLHNNMTVNASLTLTDCDLVMGSGAYHQFLNVTDNGTLSASDCTIRGVSLPFLFRVYGDTTLVGCNLSNIWDVTSYAGMVLHDGRVVIRDTRFSDNQDRLLDVHTDLVMDNVTSSRVSHSMLVVDNRKARHAFTVRLSNLSWEGTSDGHSGTRFAVKVVADDEGPHVALHVSNCSFRTFQTPLDLRAYDGGLSAVVEDCRLLNSTTGVQSVLLGECDVTMRRLVVEETWHNPRKGILVYLSPQAALSVGDVQVRGFTVGLWFEVQVRGYVGVTVENATVSDCDYGVGGKHYGGPEDDKMVIDVRNSSISSKKSDFNVMDNTALDVWYTRHTPGSVEMSWWAIWARGYTRVHPAGARWLQGPDITEGVVWFHDVDGNLVVTTNLEDIQPTTVLGWERRRSSALTIEELLPEMTIGGRTWEGLSYDLWGLDRPRVEIVDDVVPGVILDYPVNGQVFTEPHLTARGRYHEEGSGLAAVECSLDDGDFVNVTSWEDGKWELVLVDLPDGQHSLSVRPVDLVGNKGYRRTIGFVVDTGPPFFDLQPYPGVTTEPTLELLGRTEPGSNLTANGEPVRVVVDGSFRLLLELVEGENTVLLEAEDRYGNSNSTTIVVVLDTTPPPLEVLSPRDGGWYNVTPVPLRAVTEPDARAWLDGEEVETEDGTVIATLPMEEGENNVTLKVRDPAGNEVTEVLVVHVDATPPGLTVTSPEDEHTLVREVEVWLAGDVDEANIHNVTVNGEEVELEEGSFGRSFELKECDNVFRIEAVDLAGNRASALRTVCRDTIGPRYTVEMVVKGGELLEVGGVTWATAPTLLVRIFSDEVSIVELENRTVLGPSEAVQAEYRLFEGENTVSFYIKDVAGNRGRSYLTTVMLDTTPPEVRVDQPLPDSSTERGSVHVRGETEPGATVHVDGEFVAVLKDGTFETSVDLDMGRNVITVEVWDRAGHNATVTVEVVRKEEGAGFTGLAGLAALATGLAVASWSRGRRS